MDQYVSKPKHDGSRDCNCIGPANCDDTKCWLVEKYRENNTIPQETIDNIIKEVNNGKD